MFRIKRTKYMPPQPLDFHIGHPDPAIAYAKTVDALGNILTWTPDVAEAGQFGEVAVEAVKACHKGRHVFGRLDFEDLSPPAPVEPEPEPEPVSHPNIFRHAAEKVAEFIPPLAQKTEPEPEPEPEPDPEPEHEDKPRSHHKRGRKE